MRVDRRDGRFAVSVRADTENLQAYEIYLKARELFIARRELPDSVRLFERVVELARLGIAARPGTALEEAEAAVERLGATGRADLIRMPEIGVSSTQIRRRVAQGRPVRYLVPGPVADLIAERGLYREAVPA